MRPLHALILGIVLLIGAIHLAQPRAGLAGEGLLPSIQRIVERGALVIAVIEGARPPMIRREQDGSFQFGKPQGSEEAGEAAAQVAVVAHLP